MHSYNNENKKGKGEQLVSCNGAFALINSFYLFDIDTLTYNILDVNTVFKKMQKLNFFHHKKVFCRYFLQYSVNYLLKLYFYAYF